MRRSATPLLKKIRSHLKRGGIIAYATESCYGLGCDPQNFRAVRRVLRLKKRPQSKGLILIAGGFRQIEPYLASLTKEERGRLMQTWPGPVSFLLPASAKTPKWLRGQHRKIAARVTAHEHASVLCNALGSALVSTSANRSGLRPLKTWRSCVRAFGKSVLAIPGKIGTRKTPSTIIDFASGRKLRS